MDLLEKLIQYDGFVYKIKGHFYFLGKWICKEVSEQEITDCHMMFEMDMKARDMQDAGLYFHKLRAYSDFALIPPCNPALIRTQISELLISLEDEDLSDLGEQISLFEEGCSLFAAK